VNPGATFCESCGKPVLSQGQAAYPPVTPPPMNSTGLAGNPGLTSNAAAALSYLIGFITGILFLVIEPYKRDRFVRFHAFQSIFYCVACIVFHICWSIAWGILMQFSVSFFFIGAPLHLLLSLVLFGYWLFLMFQAYQQREYHVPILGAIAEKQAG
jgi:uncharacterized membrane protein